MRHAESFPLADTEERFDAVRTDEDTLLPGVRALCARLGLDGAELRGFTSGSLPVYAVGADRVLKLYPAVYRGECERESEALRATAGMSRLPAPRVLATGEHSGWEYLLMTRLPGEPLIEVWPKLSAGQASMLAGELGAGLAELHSIHPPPCLPPADWRGFLDTQRSSAHQRQLAVGLTEEWAAQITPFLDTVCLPAEVTQVLLHTEVVREHLLVRGGPTGHTLSGLFDFEPAMRGAAEYEFVAVGLFVTRGEGTFLREVLSGYGYPRDELDERLSRRLLAYTLLHEQGNLPWFRSYLPEPPERTLDALAVTWFGL